MQPLPSFARLRDAYRRGDGTAVLSEAPVVLDELVADPEQVTLVPLVHVLVGAALAGDERYPDALAYLHRGLHRADTDLARHELGSLERLELLELDLMLLVGRYREAWPVIQRLAEPLRSLESRLGAARGHLSLAAVFGDFDTAHQLLNTAAGLADQLRSRQIATVIEGDRAVVLALQARVSEALVFADHVVPMLAHAGRSAELEWSVSQGITVATSVARAAARSGDAVSAERLLAAISGVSERPPRRFDAGQIALARGVVWGYGGRSGDAEGPIADARRCFLELGCAPAAALAQLEESRVAVRRGYQASARPLLERARSELAALGLTREVAAVDALMRDAS